MRTVRRVVKTITVVVIVMTEYRRIGIGGAVVVIVIVASAAVRRGRAIPVSTSMTSPAVGPLGELNLDDVKMLLDLVVVEVD